MSHLVLHERIAKLKPSATLGMKAKFQALKNKGISVISLSAGEPNFPTPKPIIDAAKIALDKGADHYTDVRGTDEIVEAMRIKFKREQGIDYDVSEVMCTVGTKHALLLALQSVCGPGDEVVVFAPYWVTYPEQIKLCGAVPIEVHTDRTTAYEPSVEAFKKALTPRTKAILLNSPNNPSGAVWSEATLRGIMDTVKGTGIWVISDEIYERLVFDGAKHFSPATFSEDARSRTLIVTGVAKTYAMTGWRVGVVGGPKDWVSAMVKLQSQATTCVTAVAQAAAACALREDASVGAAVEEMRAAYERRGNIVEKRVKEMPGVSLVKARGGLSALLDFSPWIGKAHRGSVLENDLILNDRLLEEAHVAFVAGTPFAAPGCVRVSLAASDQDVETAMRQIAAWLG